MTQICPVGRQNPAECPLLRGNPEGAAFCDECGEPLPTANTVSEELLPELSSSPADQTAASASTPTPQARLIVEADNQEFDLSGKEEITIGREDVVSSIYPDIDLTSHSGEEGGVSRLHAHIFLENGHYMLEDENSTNFTFLNHQRLTAKTPITLHDNDEIRLGRLLLRFKTP
jgi:pSer/pThr/pTyr-binding forkhead associated (FHA) protein